MTRWRRAVWRDPVLLLCLGQAIFGFGTAGLLMADRCRPGMVLFACSMACFLGRLFAR